MYDKIVEIIINQANEINEDLTNKIEVYKKEDAPLFGSGGTLDSIALVSLIVAIEQAIEDEFDDIITLADEKAMSQKNSPYRTIGSLAKYINSLLMENQDVW